jgi:hypothetical protein
MKAVAWVGGLVVVAGLIFLAVAGFTGAVPVLISAAALVAMIGLGGTMGGRHTPNVPPATTAGGPLDPVDTSPPDEGAGGVPTDEGAGGATAHEGAGGATAEP